MKKFTRILAIVLALATIFSFAACSSKDGGEKKMKVGFIFLHDMYCRSWWMTGM